MNSEDPRMIKAREIVQRLNNCSAESFTSPKHGPGLEWQAELIAEALPKRPSKKTCLEAAEEFVKADHCKAAFYKGAKWLAQQLGLEDSE